MIFADSDIQLAWLRAALEKRFSCAVDLRRFAVRASRSTNAYIARIDLDYGDSKNEIFPKSLFLKSCRGESGFVADSEYLYYARDYMGLREKPLPYCYQADTSPTTGDYSLLLEDLSESHYSNKDVKPTIQHAHDVATELARLHAYRWGAKANELDGKQEAASQIDRFMAHTAMGFEPILLSCENDISPLWVDVLTRILQRHPSLMKKRARHLSGQTLIHGDANPAISSLPIE